MKILVTGSAGQLGSDISPLLKEAGYDIVLRDSKSLDITDRAKVLKDAEDVRPSLILNCSAYTKVDLAETERERAYAVNAQGPANLAEAASLVNAALIHVSTDFVFDGSKSTPYSETDGTNPLSVYGASKLKGEEEVIKRHAKHIIVRTSWLYGCSGANFVKTILRLAGERENLRVVYDQAGSPTWTVDLAGAILKIIKGLEEGKAEYGLFHYSNEGVASWYDFALAIVEEARAKGANLRLSTLDAILTAEYLTPAKRPAYSVFDKQKIKKSFGVSVPHWRVALRKMINELYGGKNA